MIYYFLKEEIKKPDRKTIITLHDPEGNTGKSLFFKYLYFSYAKKITMLFYESAQQLRRSKDLKNGFVFNVMYESGNNLLMEPLQITVSANFVP